MNFFPMKLGIGVKMCCTQICGDLRHFLSLLFVATFVATGKRKTRKCLKMRYLRVAYVVLGAVSY